MKRTRLETIHDILTLCTDEIKKTHIMYKANLSHRQLEKYLTLLLDKGLLEWQDGYYLTTTKGRDFITEFEKVQAVMGENNRKRRVLY